MHPLKFRFRFKMRRKMRRDSERFFSECGKFSSARRAPPRGNRKVFCAGCGFFIYMRVCGACAVFSKECLRRERRRRVRAFQPCADSRAGCLEIWACARGEAVWRREKRNSAAEKIFKNPRLRDAPRRPFLWRAGAVCAARCARFFRRLRASKKPFLRRIKNLHYIRDFVCIKRL